MLLRNVDNTMSLTKAVATKLPDDRDPKRVEHSAHQLLRQRVYALACGDEDLIDHGELRHDISLQAAVDSSRVLAST